MRKHAIATTRVNGKSVELVFAFISTATIYLGTVLATRTYGARLRGPKIVISRCKLANVENGLPEKRRKTPVARSIPDGVSRDRTARAARHEIRQTRGRRGFPSSRDPACRRPRFRPVPRVVRRRNETGSRGRASRHPRRAFATSCVAIIVARRYSPDAPSTCRARGPGGRRHRCGAYGRGAESAAHAAVFALPDLPVVPGLWSLGTCGDDRVSRRRHCRHWLRWPGRRRRSSRRRRRSRPSPRACATAIPSGSEFVGIYFGVTLIIIIIIFF